MKRTTPILLAMSILALFAKADTNAVASLQTDAFEAPNGKSVTFTCIKHGSLRIQYDGLEIQIDPVGKGLRPPTDYAQFPKAGARSSTPRGATKAFTVALADPAGSRGSRPPGRGRGRRRSRRQAS